MSVLEPNPSPPFNISRISHVVLTSRDLDKTRTFYETGLGQEVTAHDRDRLCLRAIEETGHHSLVFEKTDTDGPGLCRRIGYRAYTDDDLKRAHEYFNGRGEAAEFVERPYQGLTLQLHDGVGVPIEFCAMMDQDESRMQRFHTHAGGRLAFFDHIQIACHDLGFRLTEYTANDGTDDMWGVWLKRKNNTQDVVFGNGPGPRLHHFAYHTPEVGSVVHAADVMASLGLADTMDRAPGRHGIGNAFFIYFRDPDGHRIEIFTSHYNVIDVDHQPKRWDLSDTRRSQLWGFPAPKKWFFEASEFEGVEVRKPLMEATPVTLESFLESW
ncbi:MAG: 3,4-dihydroxyphenylacetate 2,3-dioxygenase [Hyphomicrobiales bacterium]|nr:3,4-dihydroxyphenylacetate 2,3-dioxygenase [Hyphomicrobiales bacterium]MCP4998697.1 3,4-dihydroxyphenylacetate 2,3-dioxygenase [Hyphomicrobiales bacterium]